MLFTGRGEGGINSGKHRGSIAKEILRINITHFLLFRVRHAAQAILSSLGSLNISLLHGTEYLTPIHK